MFEKPRFSTIASVAFLALLFVLAESALAASYTYTGVSGSNDWATAAKWTSSTIPGVGDDAIISLDFAGASINSNTGPAASVNTLTFNGYTGGLSSSAALEIPVTVANGATFNSKSLNNSTISGNATFNGTSGNNGGTVTGDATFNNASFDYGTVQGNAVFNGSSNFAGTVAGNVTLNTDCYGTVPSGGAIVVDGNAACAAWNFPSIVNGTLYGSDAQEITSFTFINGASADGAINGTAVFNDTTFTAGNDNMTGTFTFNDSSENYSPITGNVSFYDNSANQDAITITGDVTFYGDASEDNGPATITGTKTRHYTADTTVTRDFTADGTDVVVADGAGTVVDISGATYSCNTTTFTELNGGTFTPDPGCSSTYTFDNHDFSNEWTSLGGWLEGVVAGAGDDVIITLPAASPNHLKLNSGPAATVKTLTVNNYGGLGIDLTATNGATFNDSSSLSDHATLTGNATFNGSSQSGSNEHIVGDVTFNGTSLNQGYIVGTVIFNDDSSHSSYDGSSITGNVTFNDASANAGNITGTVIFNGASANAGNGVITGDATFNTTYYSGTVAPSGGVLTINNDGSTTVSWQGSVSGTIYGSDAAPITEWVFNDSAYTEGVIPGDATFNGDLSEVYAPGTIAGTKTRHYGASVTTLRDFTANGGNWTVVADGSGVIVDVTDATYDGTTTFVELNGGLFVPCAVSPAGCGSGTAPTATTQAASALTTTSATLNGNLTATGSAGVTVRGFAYGTDITLATVIATTTDTAGQPFSTGAFTGTLTSLTCNTTYYARAYATNSAGDGLGSIQSFTTNSCPSVSSGGGGGRNPAVVVPLAPTSTPPLLPPLVIPSIEDLPATFGPSRGTGEIIIRESNPTPETAAPQTPPGPPEQSAGFGPEQGIGGFDDATEGPNRPPFLPFAAAFFEWTADAIVALTSSSMYQPTIDLVSSIGVLIGAGALVTTIFPSLPLGLATGASSFSDLVLSVKRFWDLLLVALNFRKRRPWGVIYDSVTKRPIDPASITLTDEYGKALHTAYTDLDGRYGFLAGAGIYHIEVNKSNYVFPSVRLAGKTSDEVYDNLYLGGPLTIDAEGATILNNIPLDPVSLDWQEFARQNKKHFRYYSERVRALAFLSKWLFRAGFIIALYAAVTIGTGYDVVVLIVYLAVGLLRTLGFGPRPYGFLTEASTGQPLAYALVAARKVDLQEEVLRTVADRLGRYYALVSDGRYVVDIDRKEIDESYTPVFTSPVLTVTKGIIDERFMV